MPNSSNRPAIRTLLTEAAASLVDVSDSARLDAEILLAQVLQQDRAWLYAHADSAPEPPDIDRFEKLIEARRQGQPIAYLTGRQEFFSLSLTVTPDVLIPRADTELLVEIALRQLSKPHQRQPADNGHAPCVLDLGTGSGAIAIAMANTRPDLDVIASDRSSAALAVARDNAKRLGCPHIRFYQSDWFRDLPVFRTDLIVCNPPYISRLDPHLHQVGVRFEPASALVSGDDGLDDIRTIVSAAADRLTTNGVLMLEHGHDQGTAVRELLTRRGYKAVRTQRDLAGNERVSLGRL